MLEGHNGRFGGWCLYGGRTHLGQNMQNFRGVHGSDTLLRCAETYSVDRIVVA